MKKTVLIFSDGPNDIILYKEQLGLEFNVNIGDPNNRDLKGIDLVILNTNLNRDNQAGIKLGERIRKNYPKIAIVWLTTDIAYLNSTLKDKERCMAISRFFLSIPCDKQAEKMSCLISEAFAEALKIE